MSHFFHIPSLLNALLSNSPSTSLTRFSTLVSSPQAAGSLSLTAINIKWLRSIFSPRYTKKYVGRICTRPDKHSHKAESQKPLHQTSLDLDTNHTIWWIKFQMILLSMWMLTSVVLSFWPSDHLTKPCCCVPGKEVLKANRFYGKPGYWQLRTWSLRSSSLALHFKYRAPPWSEKLRQPCK